MFAQLFANGLVTGPMIAIAAVGVSIVYGILRLVNFAYGEELGEHRPVQLFRRIRASSRDRPCPGDSPRGTAPEGS